MDWRELPQLLADELVASQEEGRDIDGLRQAVDEWIYRARDVLGQGSALPERLRAEGEQLYAAVQGAPRRPDFPYNEPSNLDEIEVLLTPKARAGTKPVIPPGLEEKILGGWLGRAAGCLLGKPVEGWTRSRIEAYLRATGVAEIVDYLPRGEGIPSELTIALRGACRGEVSGMLRDDDMDYTVTGLMILERYGPEFTARQVGEFWLSHLPYHLVYTAERVAYRNLVDGYVPPQTATRFNPYREWIGAQIRADLFGYVAPGAPLLAARLAYRDASLSHTGNGIYGEMWVAASIAAAFTAATPREALLAGLAVIPPQSRLAEVIRDCFDWAEGEPDWDHAWRKLEEKYGRYHPVHTLNNAGLVVLAILFGEQDLARTVGLAVRGGWDTDCNGATAGSILGVWLGASRLPSHLTSPLQDRLETALAGVRELRFTELAARTGRVARLIAERYR
ncbi:MAG: ADP-ribosylglycohydrolase family protein [Limnochordales bacterium]|nr:ADP-ribosylglycohydrolase family protein [Limnochordales bacterium]